MAAKAKSIKRTRILVGIMDILKPIKERRSVRKFKKESIDKKTIDKILEAGQWAPSGLNNQPWKFLVLSGSEKDSLSEYTHYAQIIKEADKAICIFLDKEIMYNYEKDLLAVGACIQNMLLYIHSIGLGACWLGEILNKRDAINKKFNIDEDFQLEAVIALGKPSNTPKPTKRRSLKNLTLK